VKIGDIEAFPFPTARPGGTAAVHSGWCRGTLGQALAARLGELHSDGTALSAHPHARTRPFWWTPAWPSHPPHGPERRTSGWSGPNGGLQD